MLHAVAVTDLLDCVKDGLVDLGREVLHLLEALDALSLHPLVLLKHVAEHKHFVHAGGLGRKRLQAGLGGLRKALEASFNQVLDGLLCHPLAKILEKDLLVDGLHHALKAFNRLLGYLLKKLDRHIAQDLLRVHFNFDLAHHIDVDSQEVPESCLAKFVLLVQASHILQIGLGLVQRVNELSLVLLKLLHRLVPLLEDFGEHLTKVNIGTQALVDFLKELCNGFLPNLPQKFVVW